MPVRKGTSCHGHSARRARPAVDFCGEKYACSTENARAVFWCDQCTTNQCQSCELQLHQLARYQYHDRQKLQEPSPDKLCEQAAVVRCSPRNFADVICIECGHRRYCIDCDTVLHWHRTATGHTRVSVLSDSQMPSVTPPSLAVDQTSLLLPSDSSALSTTAVGENSSSYVSLPSFHSATSETADVDAVTTHREVEAAADEPDIELTDDSNGTDGVAMLSDDLQKPCSTVCCHNSHDIAGSLDGSVVSPSCETTPPASFLLLSEHEELMVNDANFVICCICCKIYIESCKATSNFLYVLSVLDSSG